MASNFKVNKQGIRNITRALEREFAKNPIRVPLEADPSGTTFPPATTVNHYGGPVVTVTGDHAQLAWNNHAVSQTQERVDQIAPGYESLTRVLTGLLAGLSELGLTDDDANEAQLNAETVLREVTKSAPDQGIVRRGVTMIKGLLAPVATGTKDAVSEESAALAHTVIDGLGSTLPF